MRNIGIILTLFFSLSVFGQKPRADVIRFKPLITAPITPEKGWVYYGDDNNLYKYNGTTWEALGGGSGSTDLIYNNGVIESSTGTNATIPDATNATKGLATAAQITKLEGIETGATADQTARDVPYIGLTGLSSFDVGSALDELKTQVDAVSGGGTGTGLEKRTESGNEFWTLVGQDPANYGDRGAFAIDFSLSSSPSTVKGASGTGAVAFQTSDASGILSFAANGDNNAGGDYSSTFNIDNDSGGYASFTAGEGNSAPSHAEIALGIYGTTYTPFSTDTYDSRDRLFNIGNGASGTPKDQFTIWKDGSVVLSPVAKSTLTTPRSHTIIIDSEESNKIKYYDGTNWYELNMTLD